MQFYGLCIYQPDAQLQKASVSSSTVHLLKNSPSDSADTKDSAKLPSHSGAAPPVFLGPERPVVSALFAAALVGSLTYLSLYASRPDPAPELPAASRPAGPVAPPMAEPEVQRAAFYDAEVEPLIVATDTLNRQAAERCVRRLHLLFKGYRDGVEPFVEDLTSISTRLGIVRRMPGNWWRKDHRIERYVQEKFETHLFSDQRLLDDISLVLHQFRRDIDVNQKRMLIDVQAALDTADLPDVGIEEYEPFFQAVAKQLQDYATRQGTTSVMNALGVFIISEAGVFTARSVIAGLLARFGAAAAAGAAAGGTATAGGAAAGASGGTLGGPIGTAVGFGVGLAVGLVIDWWMTEKFEARMTAEMNQYIDSLRNAILYGQSQQQRSANSARTAKSGRSVPRTKKAGLAEALPVVCDRLQEAYRQRFYQQIVTRGPES